METQKFIHKISKGSRFNQIYIPKEKSHKFKPGDIVEIKLLKKSVELYYSKNVKKLTPFKKDLIKKVFNFLDKYPEVKQIFIFGSFLTKKVDYNDIDILILTDGNEKKDFEEKIYKNLTDKFNLKFHIIFYDEKRLRHLLEICPLTRNMFYFYVSDKPFSVSKKTKIDKNHIKFLLMMAEDLLETNIKESQVYYNELRKLHVIENFLNGKEISPKEIDSFIKKTLGEKKLSLLKKSFLLDTELLKDIKKLIKNKLSGINEKLETFK